MLCLATHYSGSVLASGKLMLAQSGSPVVSFTRSHRMWRVTRPRCRVTTRGQRSDTHF